MDNGSLYEYFPTTGGRDEIAPYPLWASLYLLSMDYRLAEEVDQLRRPVRLDHDPLPRE